MSTYEHKGYIISELRVMHSAAGYYIGTACFDPVMPEAGCNLPWDRITGYMSKSEAIRALPLLVTTEECATAEEQDGYAEYRSAIEDGLGVDRAVYDALWVQSADYCQFAAPRRPGRVDEPTVAMPAEQEPYQFDLPL